MPLRVSSCCISNVSHGRCKPSSSVRNRLSGNLVLKLFVGHRKIPVRPQLQDFRGHGYKLGFERKTVKQVFQTADACCQYQNMAVTLLEHLFYVSDIHRSRSLPQKCACIWPVPESRPCHRFHRSRPCEQAIHLPSRPIAMESNLLAISCTAPEGMVACFS